jgi:anti-anti-sigma factor
MVRGAGREATPVDLSVSTEQQNATAIVTLTGELDLSSQDLVDRTLDQAVGASGVRQVVVDLSGLRFIDSSGIAVLLKGRRRADEAEVGYRVDAAEGIVRQVLSLTGVLEHLSGESA